MLDQFRKLICNPKFNPFGSSLYQLLIRSLSLIEAIEISVFTRPV